MKITKNMNNLETAELLSNISASYQIKDANKNRFRIIAYQRASVAVEHLSSEAKDLWDEGKLADVGGIGESISKHLGEIFSTGRSKHFEWVMKGIPRVTFEMMKISGIGPKTAFKLSTELKIKSIKDLENKAKKGEISKLEGMGEESEEAILQSIADLKNKKEKRLLLPYALGRADEIIKWLDKNRFVREASTLGSLRRKVSTIGDIDIAVSADNSVEVLEHFVNYPKKTRVVEKGKTESSIIIPGDIRVDLRVVDPKMYGSMLQHFTGSKEHNIALREYAMKKKLSLSEYGIKKNEKILKFNTEEDFYKYLGMKWIPPELRESSGEIEIARSNNLPKLVKESDIKADLQIHSDFDIETSHDLGTSSMKDIIKTASRLKYEYIAFTEHNPSKSKHNDRQIIELVKRKRETIDKINYSLKKDNKYSVKKVFNSLEIDMLTKGGVPMPEKALEELDFALASIHTSFNLSKNEMTKRVLASLAHPKIKVFAHPTARKLNDREGVELDWENIFDYCLKNNKWIEVNADPARLDLPDHLVKEAVGRGVKLTLGTDAHNTDGLDNMKYGVWVARRGWAERKDIVNTSSLAEFEKMLLS